MSFHQEKLVKTRKKQQCTGCLRVFDLGTVLLKQAGCQDGEFYSSYLCDYCQESIKRIEPGEFFMEGDFWEDLPEEVQEQYLEERRAKQ